ncbi:unnamed protein product [Cuscuta campestris]|uniref:tRNA pseudouridine synthase n=1 Tax=Cuscuta campestris TaxID=132261 RepID=A0A484LLP4_9ASTE|nr:unnamed protein product [Cuscuta campestris]
MVKGQSKLEDMFQREIPTIQDEAEAKEYSVEPELGSFPVEDRTGRWARVTFKIVLSYHGPSFGGWQKQPGLNTVQEMVERSLGKFVDDKKAQQLKDRNLPLEGCALVAGRTDKGVSAFQQVCSFCMFLYVSCLFNCSISLPLFTFFFSPKIHLPAYDLV